MTVASVIQDMIENSMLSAFIDSPRFEDYKIRRVDLNPTGLEELLEMELKALIKSKEGGEAENKKAGKMFDQHVKAYGKFKREEDESEFKLDSQIASGISQGVSAARNPMGAIEGLLGKLPHSALILLAVALAPMIIEELKKPGSMLDVRFRRMMMDEFNAMLERQDQWDTMLGLRQTIVQSKSGFLMESGAAMTETNLRQRREGGADGNRLALIDMVDHAKELF